LNQGKVRFGAEIRAQILCVWVSLASQA